MRTLHDRAHARRLTRKAERVAPSDLHAAVRRGFAYEAQGGVYCVACRLRDGDPASRGGALVPLDGLLVCGGGHLALRPGPGSGGTAPA